MTPLLLAMERILLEVGNTVRRDFVEIEHLQNTKRLDGFVVRALRSVARSMIKQLENVYPEDAYHIFPHVLTPPPPEEDPDHPKKPKDSKRTWHLFPVEGFVNFTHGLPFFCTALALMEEGQIQAAALMTPSLQDLFLVQRGKGAFRGRYRIHFKQESTLHNAPVGIGPGLFPRPMEERPSWRMSGSPLFDLTMVAAGFLKGTAWLHAPLEKALEPGYLLVQEAGHTVLPCRAPREGIIVATPRCAHLLQTCLKVSSSKTPSITTPILVT